jgi:hypothetical protein
MKPALALGGPDHNEADRWAMGAQYWHKRAEAAEALCEQAQQERDELRLSHSGEGTHACTCRSYPHLPDCGLDWRILALRTRAEAAEAENATLRAEVARLTETQG